MKKRIFAIISTILILAVFTLSTFANVDKDVLHNETNIGAEYSVGPVQDEVSRYKMVVNPYYTPNITENYTDYPIYDIHTSGIGVLSDFLKTKGLIQHFVPSYTDDDLTGYYDIMLADESHLILGFSSAGYLYGKYNVYNTSRQLVKSVTLFDMVEQGCDVLLYMDYNANICMMIYDKSSKMILSSTTFNVQMYGIIYPQDVFPFASQISITNAFNQGYQQGKTDGEQIGSQVANNRLQQEYNRGHDEGYRLGFDEGEDKGYLTGMRENSKAAYNQGKIDGENISKSLDNMFTDLFSGLGDFFGNFMQLGIGPLTMFNLLSVIITAFLIITLAKIIRG